MAKKQHSGAPAEQGSGGQKARGKRGIGTSAKVIIGVVAAILIFGFGASVGAGDVSFGVRRHAANANLPARLDYSSVNAEYSLLRQKYDGKLTSQQLLNGMKKGMAKATGDPYTVYFTPKEAKHFHSELNNSFTGIGAQLGKDKQGRVQVIAPLKGFPAQKAGLKAQDRITSINGKSTSGMSVAEAAKRIRGKAGTTVKLGLARVAEHGGARKLTIAITRARIHLPSVTAKILPDDIGVMSVSTFADDTGKLAQKAARKFKNHHVKGVIVDLRDNPGGEVKAAVDVCGLWVKQNAVVMQEKRDHHVLHTYRANGGDLLRGLPTAVLVNGGSASAAEITTGALHDHHQAKVIGVKTYGKGVVQQVIDLRGGAKLKVTTASWYRPNGKNIEHRGITPDKVVKLSKQAIKQGTDTQLQAAKKYLEDRN